MTEKKGSGIIGEEQLSESIALICCEGDCINGEIVREAANILCDSIAPGKTVLVSGGGFA
ncbi:MAG: hypothetical protein OS130_13530 [Thermodesulfobacteriota bacterium]|nr:MAG: hypothetical protein OS130_13530 [Thermodesulfobacteriota bacterium]